MAETIMEQFGIELTAKFPDGSAFSHLLRKTYKEGQCPQTEEYQYIGD